MPYVYVEPEPIKLGELIKLIERRPKDEEVFFDFGYFRPNGIHSYRGFYEQLAVGYSNECSLEVKVPQFIELLKSAIGKRFHGWKGGEYVMREDTRVWAAESDEANSTAIVGIYECDYRTILKTEWIES